MHLERLLRTHFSTFALKALEIEMKEILALLSKNILMMALFIA